MRIGGGGGGGGEGGGNRPIDERYPEDIISYSKQNKQKTYI